MKIVICLLCLAAALPAFAQTAVEHKCAPDLRLAARETGAGSRISIVLALSDLQAFETLLEATRAPVQIRARYAPANVAIVETETRFLYELLLPCPLVLFADVEKTVGKLELKVPGQNLYLNKINRLQEYAGAHPGGGQTVSIKENLFDTTDVDLLNRIRLGATQAEASPHASAMATLIGGAGTSDSGARGVADGCTFTHSDFAPFLPDADSVYAKRQVRVQNHSYGIDGTCLYGPDALSYDQSVVIRPDLLHVFSAGNEGTSTGKSVEYQNITGFSNITGSFKTAKNALTVGAVDSFGNVSAFSSRGPRYDGRIAPDICAFGQDGTSGAAALVSGTALVLQEQFESLHNGASVPAGLMRAFLLNSADDIGRPGPDFETGFGNLNALKAYLCLRDGHFFTKKLADAAQRDTFLIEIPPATAQFKATLAWDDPPAPAGTARALVNDLDLVLQKPDGQTVLPRVLNSTPDADSLRLPARPGRDSLNNAEQLYIDNPEPGQYRIIVGASKLKTAQEYHIAYTLSPQNTFEWTCPIVSDWVFGGQTAVLYWQTNLPSQPGVLEYRLEQQDSWVFIDSVADIRSGAARWPAPDTFAHARLRMLLENGDSYETNLLISKDINLKIGLNCPDSLLLSWPNAGYEARYVLYGLRGAYMEPLFETSDTQVVLKKSLYPQRRFAVTLLSPAGFNGARSAAPDIDQQDAGCYLKNFIAEGLSDSTVHLSLEIGTVYGLKSVEFEVLRFSGYVSIREILPENHLNFEYFDHSALPGTNFYRAKLNLLNGLVLYSEPATVYFPGPAGWYAYPNPLGPDGIWRVLSNRPGESALRLFDAAGRLVLSMALDDRVNLLDLGYLPQGVYFYEITANGERAAGRVLR